VVPHHGSRSSSTGAFLDTVRPRLALLPVGYRNRYRHPDPGVVSRYRERGIALADSPEGGAIRVQFDARGMRVERYRDTHRRYWHGQ
jgi:competence protein ComEC